MRLKYYLVTGLALCALSLTVPACKGGKGGGGGGKTAMKKLHDTGLKAAVPAAANIGKAIMGKGAMVTSGETGAVNITKAKKEGADLAKVKKDIEMYSPKNIKTETLSDGWVLTFENKGGMGMSSWVKVYRKVGGTGWMCETTAPKKAQQAGAVALCKSITQ
jgi:hypothetical protein